MRNIGIIFLVLVFLVSDVASGQAFQMRFKSRGGATIWKFYPSSGDLLLEDGDKLKNEDESFILLEAATLIPGNLLNENGTKSLNEDGTTVLMER